MKKSSLPLISLIIPVFNTKPYLGKCLSSVKNQTYKNLEIILIDDGSTDGSGELCDECKNSNKNQSFRIKVIHQTNSGLSAARNAGLELATGDFIAFLDSDDYLANDCIELLVNNLTGSDALISLCSHFEVKPSGDKKLFAGNAEPATLSVETALRNMLNEQGFNLQTTAKLFSCKLFDTSPKIRFPVGKLHEDVGTTYRLFLRAFELNPSSKIPFSPSGKYFYNIHSGSLAQSQFTFDKLDLVSQTDEMCDAVDAVFPDLKQTTNLRRLHARFSILRQLTEVRNKSSREQKLEASLILYVKLHKSWVLNNPEAGKRDKLALYSLLLGKPFFKSAWRFYERFIK